MSDSATPWTAALQAFLSFTIALSLLKFLSTESMMPSNHLFLCFPFSPCPQSFPALVQVIMGRGMANSFASICLTPLGAPSTWPHAGWRGWIQYNCVHWTQVLWSAGWVPAPQHFVPWKNNCHILMPGKGSHSNRLSDYGSKQQKHSSVNKIPFTYKC